MMKFENTERYTATDRIRVVSNEIIHEYPMLNAEDVMKISALCDIVFDDVDEDVIFRRYYYILLVIKDNLAVSKKVFDDMCKYCKDCLKDRLNRILYTDLERFFNGELENFPVIGDYYGNE